MRGRPRATVAAESRRDALLRVAGEQFARLGYKKTSVDGIVAAVGCAKGAFYLEFESKDALLAAVLDGLLAGAAARYAAQVQGVASARERVALTMRWVFREMAEHPLMERLIRDDEALGPLRRYAAGATREARADAEVEGMRALLREGVARGELRADLDVAMMPFVLSLLRFVHYHTELATMGRVPRERLLDALVDVVVAGISAPPPPPAGAPDTKEQVK
jgi:AcrR family transcriptional regulator